MAMLEKLKIYAYKDTNLTQKIGEYTLQINPEKYAQKHATTLTKSRTTDTAGVTTKFNVHEPQDLTFEFYFDATGMVPGITNLPDAIKSFKTLVYTYNGDIHSPNYLRLLWGELNFDCRITSLDIEYVLFNPNGIPLRAKINTTFKEYLSPQKIALQAKKNSPDMTHARIAVAGDTLPLMCFRIYQDSRHYLDIARVNNLSDFRNLKPGQQIFFPPLGD